MEGTLLKRTWTPTDTTSVKFQDKLVIYDGGDFIGFLIERADGSREWQGAFLQDRTDTEETLLIANEFYTPKTYFRIEEYPLSFHQAQGQQQLLIPGWLLQQQQHPLQQQKQPNPLPVQKAMTHLHQKDQPVSRKGQSKQAPVLDVQRQKDQQQQSTSPQPSSQYQQPQQPRSRGSRAGRQVHSLQPERSSKNTESTSSS